MLVAGVTLGVTPKMLPILGVTLGVIPKMLIVVGVTQRMLKWSHQRPGLGPGRAGPWAKGGPAQGQARPSQS